MPASCRRSLNIEHLFLINDLEANGYGIPELTRTRSASSARATQRDRAPGAGFGGHGLGEAVLVWTGGHHVPIPSEGGHSDFRRAQ
jgi:glucokinase